MELFSRAKAVRLKSRHTDKFLYADEDEVHVTQDRNGASKNTRWQVEPVATAHGERPQFVRLKSCYGRYLTASNEPFLLGMTGRKVLQTVPQRLDSSVEWEPVRESGHLVVKTRYGQFLKANGGLPPWRNSVTHDQGSAGSEGCLWDLDIVQVLTPRGDEMLHKAGSMPTLKAESNPPVGGAPPHGFDGCAVCGPAPAAAAWDGT